MNDNMKQTFSIINERGIVGGIYLGVILFVIILMGSQTPKDNNVLAWVFSSCFLMGFILSSVSYEIFMPLIRIITNIFVLKGFNHKLNGNNIDSYQDIRTIRATLLSSDLADNSKKRIINDENIRQILTFLITSSIFLIIFIFFYGRLFSISDMLLVSVLSIITYILVCSAIGVLLRSFYLGANIASAKHSNDIVKAIHG